MRNKTILLGATVIGLSLAYAAYGAAPAIKDHRELDPASVPSGSYVTESDHTRILFTVNHHGYSTFFGLFTNVKAELTLDKDNIANSKLTAEVAMDSLTTMVYPQARQDWFHNQVDTPDMFDFEKYPKANFVATKIERTDKNKARVTGDLTLHGVTKPVVMDVVFNAAGEGPQPGYRVGFQGTMVVKRFDFGMTGHGVTAGGPGVGNDVTLNIEAEFLTKK